MTWSLRECDCCNSSAVRSPLLMENVSSRHHTQDELVKYEFDLLRTYCPHCRHKRNPHPAPTGDGGCAGPGYLPQIAQIEDTAHFPSSATTLHACLDYPLVDYSHLDSRRLDYKAIWTTPNTYDIWTIAVWTIPIGLLVHLDYQNLDYIPNRLHCHLDYIRISVQNILDCAMYCVIKRLKKT